MKQTAHHAMIVRDKDGKRVHCLTWGQGCAAPTEAELIEEIRSYVDRKGRSHIPENGYTYHHEITTITEAPIAPPPGLKHDDLTFANVAAQLARLQELGKFFIMLPCYGEYVRLESLVSACQEPLYSVQDVDRYVEKYITVNAMLPPLSAIEAANQG